MYEEKIKLKKLGEEFGCLFDDEIDITLSPGNVSRLAQIFKELSVESNDYDEQGEYREFAELFDKASRIWRSKRDDILHDKKAKAIK